MISTTTDGRQDGERRKRDAPELLQSRRELYVRSGQRALLSTLLGGASMATTDDVCRAVELLPGIIQRRPWEFGKRWNNFPRRVRQSVPTCRERSTVDRLAVADAAAAQRWLDTHADMPDPTGPADDSTTTPTVAAAGCKI